MLTLERVERALIHEGDGLYHEIDKLSWLCKNVYNSALYEFRQRIFDNRKLKNQGKKPEKYLTAYDVITMFTRSGQVDYCAIPAKLSQEVIKSVYHGVKSFVGSITSKKVTHSVSLPRYKDKSNGRAVITFNKQMISSNVIKVRDNLYKYTVMPKSLGWEFYCTKPNVKNIRVIPCSDHYSVDFVYSVDEVEPVKSGVMMGIDLGVGNIVSMITTNGYSTLINGNPLKAINRFYSDRLASYCSKLPKGVKTSKRIKNLTCKRNRKIDWEIHNISRFVVTFAVSTGVDTIVIGNNKHWKQSTNMGKVNNQNFVSIPHARLINQIVSKAEEVGIHVIATEESYTSRASSLDNDVIPVYGDDVSNIAFSGKRYRGLYYTNSGIVLNADLNGALNIIRKIAPNAKVEGVKGAVVRPMKFTIPRG